MDVGSTVFGWVAGALGSRAAVYALDRAANFSIG